MLKLTTILVDFACWSTVACIRNVALSGSKLLRLFWFLVFVAMVAAFVSQLVMIILKYLAYPADVSTSIVFSSQPFPDVTFCNYNPYKWSVVSTNPDFADIKRMLVEFKAADDDNGMGGGSNEFGFQGLSRYERHDRATDLLVFFAAQLTEAQKAPALYDLEELVTECLFEGVTCDPELIQEVPDPVYGRCFVYKGGNQTISRSGLAHGLRLILTANLADSFTFVSDFLPTTLRVGVRMTVNEEDSLVSLDNHGFNVGVGFQTSIAISKSRTERVQAPYGHCVNGMAEGTNYYADLPYTIDSCFTSCLQKRITDSCGCAHPAYRKAVNDTWCSTPEDATCIATLRGDQLATNGTNLNPIGECGCNPPCKESYFSSTLSVLTYPAFGYTVGVGTTNQLKDLKKDQETKTTPDWTRPPTTTKTTTTRTSTARPTTTTVSTTTTTKASTTTTSTTTKTPTTTSTTTKAPTTTTTVNNCPFASDPDKLETYNRIMASGMFKLLNPCEPRFECDPKYAAQWWTCWPCYYECPGNRGRLPIAPFTTPDVKCKDFFKFAAIEVGIGKSDRPPESIPSFNNWISSNNDPNGGQCDSEAAKMVPASTTSTSKKTTTTTSTTPSTTTSPSTTTTEPTTTTVKTTTSPINWVTSCNTIQGMIWNNFGAVGYAVNGIVGGGNKPTASPVASYSNWYDKWPCSYKCSDGTRFPTNPVLDNVKCVDFFKCFEISTNKFTNEPSFNDWDEGGTGNDDCAAMQSGGTVAPPATDPPNPTPAPPAGGGGGWGGGGSGGSGGAGGKGGGAESGGGGTADGVGRKKRSAGGGIAPIPDPNDSTTTTFTTSLPSMPPTSIPNGLPTVSTTLPPTGLPTLSTTLLPTGLPTLSTTLLPNGLPSLSTTLLPNGLPSIPTSILPNGLPTVSTTTVSTKGNNTQIYLPGKGSCESWNSNFKTVEACQTWYKKNAMIVNVFYESLEYQVLTESAAYSLSLAVSDLGGQAGLWLGLSVVSIVECIGLVFMLLLLCITGKRMSVNGEREHRKMPDLEVIKPTRGV